jgi:hypothetical protein
MIVLNVSDVSFARVLSIRHSYYCATGTTTKIGHPALLIHETIEHVEDIIADLDHGSPSINVEDGRHKGRSRGPPNVVERKE